MTEPRAIQSFRANIRSVAELMKFDDQVLDFILDPLEKWAARVSTADLSIDNPRHRPDNIVRAIRNLRTSGSLSGYYREMYNQCVVLMVSYFASATRELFVEAVSLAVRQGNEAVLGEELKIEVRELTDLEGDLGSFIGAALADKKDMSFQDMQSIDRGFRQYFEFAPPKDEAVNDIIAAQACRNAIVHAGAVVDTRLVRQLRSASPRTVKPTVMAGEHLKFTISDIERVQEVMLRYLVDLNDGLIGVQTAMCNRDDG